MSKLLKHVLVIALFVIAGCAQESGNGVADTDAVDGPINSPPPPTVDAHAHPSHGPHEGELIELGNEEYHAELLHDATSMTIYVLDSAATEAVPIEATEIHVNLKHDGQPEQFVLAASPTEDDPAGKSSRFVSEDAELIGHLDEEEAQPQLVLTIDGNSYRGSLAHDHDHGHSHD